MFRYVASVLAALLLTSASFAQVSLTNASPTYTQNFDTLPNTGTNAWTDNTMLANWYAEYADAAGSLDVRGDNGASNSGDMFSYGVTATTERAFGSLSSGSTDQTLIGLRLKNNGATPITALTISYRGEQWRLGRTGGADTFTFYYKVSASAITDITKTEAAAPATNGYTAGGSAFNFVSPTTAGTLGALVGNDSPNFTNITNQVLTVAIPVGSEIMIAWQDVDDGGSDQGIAIDDLSVSATFEAAGNNVSIAPLGFTLTNRDAADAPTNQVAVVSATANINITNVALTGSADWTYVGTSTPFAVNSGTTASLGFRYTPAANDAVVDITTATVTTDGLPASFTIVLSGNTVKEVSLAQLRTEAETNVSGMTIYKVSGIANSNVFGGYRNQFTIQSEASGSASTRGVWIDDSAGTGKGAGSIPAIGETVTVWGSLTVFRGLVELVPSKAYLVTASGASLSPYSITSAGLGDSVEGVLVTIPAAVIPAATYTESGTGVNITTSDDGGTTTFTTRLAQGSAISYTGINVPLPLTGVVSQYHNVSSPTQYTGGNGYQVFPRSASEVPVELGGFELQ